MKRKIPHAYVIIFYIIVFFAPSLPGLFREGNI